MSIRSIRGSVLSFVGKGNYIKRASHTLHFFKPDCKQVIPTELIKMQIKWKSTGNPEYPYQSCQDESIKIRINDFPAETLYSLLQDNKNIYDMDSLPKQWDIPTVQPGFSEEIINKNLKGIDL